MEQNGSESFCEGSPSVKVVGVVEESLVTSPPKEEASCACATYEVEDGRFCTACKTFDPVDEVRKSREVMFHSEAGLYRAIKAGTSTPLELRQKLVRHLQNAMVVEGAHHMLRCFTELHLKKAFLLPQQKVKILAASKKSITKKGAIMVAAINEQLDELLPCTVGKGTGLKSSSLPDEDISEDLRNRMVKIRDLRCVKEVVRAVAAFTPNMEEVIAEVTAAATVSSAEVEVEVAEDEEGEADADYVEETREDLSLIIASMFPTTPDEDAEVTAEEQPEGAVEVQSEVAVKEDSEAEWVSGIYEQECSSSSEVEADEEEQPKTWGESLLDFVSRQQDCTSEVEDEEAKVEGESPFVKKKRVATLLRLLQRVEGCERDLLEAIKNYATPFELRDYLYAATWRELDLVRYLGISTVCTYARRLIVELDEIRRQKTEASIFTEQWAANTTEVLPRYQAQRRRSILSPEQQQRYHQNLLSSTEKKKTISVYCVYGSSLDNLTTVRSSIELP